MLRDLELLSPRERKQLLGEWNSTASDFPATLCLHELFDAQAQRTPDATAVSFGHRRLSYGELQRRSNQLAHYLRREGVGPDALVAIYMERSLEMVVAALGVLKAGGAYLPIDIVHPRARVQHMLEDSRARTILTQEQLWNRLPFDLVFDAARRFAVVQGRRRIRALFPPVNITPENLAYVIYTSG